MTETPRFRSIQTKFDKNRRQKAILKPSQLGEIMQNTSGQGKDAVIPEEIKGWNWGAMMMNWVWGLFNGTFIALLMFVPFVNFVMFFILGAKGNEWAWRNKKWDSVEHFKSVQRKWAIAGLIILVVGVVLGAAGGMMAPTISE
jgi:hypothetical protein